MAAVSSKDQKLVDQVQAESGSSGLASIVGMRLEDKQREIDALRAQIEGLRSAIYGTLSPGKFYASSERGELRFRNGEIVALFRMADGRFGV